MLGIMSALLTLRTRTPVQLEATVAAATGLFVRPFSDDDYEAAVAISNRSYPGYDDTVEEVRHRDRSRNPKMVFERFMAELDGRAVGVASFSHAEYSFHPNKFYIDVAVDPDARGQGVGAAMYAHLWAVVAAYDPITLYASTREDYGHSVRFLERRGFEPVMQSWESRLALQSFDPTPYADACARVADSGNKVLNLSELKSDARYERKLYEMGDQIGRDVPSPEPHTSVDFDVWVNRLRTNPNLLPELYLVAVDDGEYVGLSNMWASQHDPTIVYTGLTGVLRSHRRRGIALALKVEAIERAARLGYVETRTWNETGNDGMLAINNRLGFVRQPAWTEYAKNIEPVI